MKNAQRETAILGGGCFWCIEAAFQQLAGIEGVEPGYAGGARPNPTYEQVCSGATGHAEVVKITYDPDEITFRDLLDAFFTVHDPTTRDRQGADVGTQYRSVIFYTNEAQRQAAEEAIRELDGSGSLGAPVVTEVAPAPPFFKAEAYHRDYYLRNTNQPYCQVVIAPKLAKLRQSHADRLRDRTGGSERSAEHQVLPFQSEPPSPIDHGGIAD